MEEKNYTIALLIDSDNVSPRYLSVLMKELIALGRVTYKRMYGDFTSPQKNGWRDLVNQFSVIPVQQYTYTSGKNVTDSKMIIDAMDILYTGNVDAFCIMSSDSDFTGLAKRLKESNMFVIGAGESKTPASFINACDRFFKLDSLIKPKPKRQERQGAPAKEAPVKETPARETAPKKAKRGAQPAAAAAAAAAADSEPQPAAQASAQQGGRGTAVPKASPQPVPKPADVPPPREEKEPAAEEEPTHIEKEEIEDFAISLLEGSNRSELPLSFIMQKIYQAYPDFDLKDYGVSKSRKFFDEKKFSQKKGKGTEILICLREDL